MRSWSLFAVSVFFCVAGASAESGVLRIGVVADGESEFWTAMRDTMLAAATEQNVEVDFQIPVSATMERQNEIITGVIAAGAQAVAICPVNAGEQTALLNEIAAKVPLITVLRDAPESKRLAFMGRSEQETGRLMAQGLLQNLMPGMRVMVFCKEPESSAAKECLAGLKEVLDPTETTIVNVIGDKGDRMVAVANMEEVIQKQPEVAALIGMEPYQVPAMVRAVTDTERARMVRIIGVGVMPEMKEYLKQGTIHCLIADDPEGIGSLAVQTLSALAKGEQEGIPENGFIAAPQKMVNAESAMSLEDMMNELQVQVPWISEVTPGAP